MGLNITIGLMVGNKFGNWYGWIAFLLLWRVQFYFSVVERAIEKQTDVHANDSWRLK